MGASPILKKKLMLVLIVIAISVSTMYLYQASHFKILGIAQNLTEDVKHDSRSVRKKEARQEESEKSMCVYPQVNPFDPQIMKLAGLDRKTIRCDIDFMPEITFIDGLNIKVNASKVSKSVGFGHCKYRNITRLPFKDYSVNFSSWSSAFVTSIQLSDEHEFVHVECYGKKDTKAVVSKAFYSLVPKRKHLDPLYDVRLGKRQQVFKPKETLNVIIVALDGLPRHQLLRGMPKTYKHITEELKSFDFTMHSQVADNTFPNFLALLSGSSYKEVLKYWNFKKPEDVFDLLWHEFERAGYRTLYTEDYPRGAGFYWGNRSFLYPQTSYWNRPLELAMLEEKDFIRRKSACAGPQPISEYQLNYIIRFLETFPRQPVACQTFIINLTHDDSTQAGLIDEHILNFYRKLQKIGQLDKSLVVLLSDHGQRWGKIRQTHNGIVESRNPFLFLTFPRWFLNKYPDVAENLKTNTGRLTSHFDTRRMLLDLLYFKSTEEETPVFRGRHGISLFHKIPANRTCGEASVPPSQCLCGQNVQKYINVDSALAKSVAAALLQAVKEKSDPQKCEEYRLERVLQVGVLSMPGASISEKKRLMVSSVRITVQPGGAMFEGTIFMNLRTKQASVGNNIERLNMYKGEVECLPTSREQMYCYCKGNDLKKANVTLKKEANTTLKQANKTLS